MFLSCLNAHASKLIESVCAFELCLPGPLTTWSRSPFHVDMLSDYTHASQQIQSVCAPELYLLGPHATWHRSAFHVHQLAEAFGYAVQTCL